ncbi:MAG TPA: hypothetical protein VGM06_06725 [Polyangiaceae bacterium]|jgi:hypothetical protein
MQPPRAWPFALTLAVAAAPAVAGGCSHPPPVSTIEDKARRDVPIAICRKFLAVTDNADGGPPKPDVYFSAIVPSFHGFSAPLDNGARSCVGDLLSAGAGPGAALSVVTADDLVSASDESGLQATWLRSFHAGDRVAAGPLALVRPRAAELDVYALGDYRGSAKHSRFELARVGAVMLVVAHDEGCADVKVDTECESSIVFYVKAGGRLVTAAKTPAQRIQYGMMKDIGHVKYRFATDPPTFDAHAVTIKEHLSVRDQADEEVRRVEGDRVFSLQNDGTLAPNQDSVWAQVPPPK